jgi:aryl-alcohol dehydrogenase-like predicted oxidoreductase
LTGKLADVAARARATPGQAALAWRLAQGTDIVPIFGTTRRARLQENLGATAVRLASCDQFLLDQVFAPGNVAGDRYLPAGMALLDRDP